MEWVLEAQPATHFSRAGSELGPRDVAYVACSQAGWPGEQANFLLTIDLRDGIEHRAVSELHFPCEHDEVRALSWLTDDRSRLIAAASNSSQLYVVDVGMEPARPQLIGAIAEDTMRFATGCTGPTHVAAIGGSRALVALQKGGTYGHGALAIYADTRLEALTRDEDCPTRPICHLAVAVAADIAAALIGDPVEGCDTLVTWDLGTGHVLDVCEIPLGTSITVTHDSAGECRGIIACKQGYLVQWTVGGLGLSVRTVSAVRSSEDRLVPATGLTASADGSHIYLGDWLAGVLVSYRLEASGELKEAGSVRLLADGEPDDTRWQEMVRAHGRDSIGGPLNLTITPDGRALVVTNGAWRSVERRYFREFSSWFALVRVEGGHLSVDDARTMSIVNRPRGEARYGPALTSWIGENRHCAPR